MKIAVHHSTLRKITKGEVDQLITHFVLSSKLSITPSILQTYHQLLGGNPLFTAWFSAAQTHKRIDIVNPSEAPKIVQDVDKITQEYGSASYFAGSNLFLSQDDFDQGSLSALNSVGTNLIYSTSPLPNEIHGDNPFHTISTKTNGTFDFCILDPFLLPEERIVIYDRYINNISIELIKYIAQRLKANSSLHIYHSNKQQSNLLNSNQIYHATAAANPQITVTCQHTTHNFTREHHDRYMFFGNRCQAIFSAGLDCFGPINPATGRRNNRKSTISFFDTSKAGILTIDGANGLQQVVRHYAG